MKVLDVTRPGEGGRDLLVVLKVWCPSILKLSCGGLTYRGQDASGNRPEPTDETRGFLNRRVKIEECLKEEGVWLGRKPGATQM